MSFCRMCGQQRIAGVRFCTACGAEFTEEPVAAETRVAEEPQAWGPTRWDQPVAEPAPAQPWAAYPPPGPPPAAAPPAQPTWAARPPDDPWLASPTQSLIRPPSPPAPAAPPAPPAFQPPGARPPFPIPPNRVPPTGQQWPAYGRQPPRSGRGGRKTALIVAVAVVAVLAAGGGAFALVSAMKGHPTAGPSAHATVTSPSRLASSTPAPSPAPSAASLTPSPTAPANPSPSPTGVSIAPGVAANSATPAVQALLNRYFTAINTRNYTAYNSLLDAQLQASDTSSSFYSGYATTKDSAETLTSIADTGAGDLAATVSFTSHQNPADSINNSSCTMWTITLYLVPQGSSYVITAPPSSYHSTHLNC